MDWEGGQYDLGALVFMVCGKSTKVFVSVELSRFWHARVYTLL